MEKFKQNHTRCRKGQASPWFLILLGFCMVWTAPSLQAQGLRISEFSTGSASHWEDEDGETSGWMELINAGPRKVNLKKYGLSDTTYVGGKWHFPRHILLPGERVLVHLSGKDRKEKIHRLHANFGLNASESPQLYYRDELIHILPPQSCMGCESHASFDSTYHDFLPFAKGSPGQPNTEGLLAHSVIAFDNPAGIYDRAIPVLPSFESDTLQLRYSLDGTDPTADSPLVQGPIRIDSTTYSTSAADTVRTAAKGHPFYLPNSTKRITVLGVALFDPAGNPKSETAFQSYISKNQSNRLPIFSLIGDWEDLFSSERGILNPGDLRDSLPAGNCDRRGRDWEREVYTHFFAGGDEVQSLPMGLRTHGGSSRKSQQKGLRLYMRKSYGQPRMQINMFNRAQQVERLALKPASRSYSSLGIEDHLSCFMAHLLKLETPHHLFSEVYINGVYQGVYTLHPRIDENWLKTEYNAQDPILLEGWDGRGSDVVDSSFVNLIDFATENDLSDPTSYRHMANQMDIDNFIDYQIFEQFIMNRDWPQGNVKCWRDNVPGSKWRWIFFDGDAGIQFSKLNGLKHALGESQCPYCRTGGNASILLKKFWENDQFRNKFKERARHITSNIFTTENTAKWVKATWSQLQSSFQDQIDRFGHTSLDEGQKNLNIISNFLKSQQERYMGFLDETPVQRVIYQSEQNQSDRQ